MERQAKKALEQKQGIKPSTVTCSSQHGKRNPLFPVEDFGVVGGFFPHSCKFFREKNSEFISCPTGTRKGEEKKK